MDDRAGAAEFERSVFINCPFDEAYRPLLRALLFTVLDCGLVPRIASEAADAGEVRILKIHRLVRESRYSVHDLSRIEPRHPGALPRFNMPFELGLDLGARYYGDEALARKRTLILERERFRYREVLSDIAGQDVRAHRDDPQQLVAEVRNWLKVTLRSALASGSQIWQRFNEFTAWLQWVLTAERFSSDEIDRLETSELIELAQAWLGDNPGPAPRAESARRATPGKGSL